LMKSPVTSPISTAASAMSPIAHQSIPGPSTGHSPNAGPGFDSSNASSPATHSASSSECPKTRAQLEQHIQAEGSSIFAPPPPQENDPRTQVFRAPAGADGPMIMCKGATFPMTEKSDNNIEVLTAWRSITSHPDFKASVSISPFLSLAHATHSNF
jgi:AP-1-like factor